jgi:hypothetical protein
MSDNAWKSPALDWPFCVFLESFVAAVYDFNVPTNAFDLFLVMRAVHIRPS